uniref:Uncharacterized protein n=1 Tax=Cacopsylla melanoneura TaxID=428564 RepID=A0A8D9B521_9HEMI
MCFSRESSRLKLSSFPSFFLSLSLSLLGVILCDNSLDSILFTSLHPPPSNHNISILVLFNLNAMFYRLNRFIFDFSPPMMQFGPRDYFNVDETGRAGAASRPSSGNMYPLTLALVLIVLCFKQIKTIL